jgi:hypothetical protein
MKRRERKAGEIRRLKVGRWSTKVEAVQSLCPLPLGRLFASASASSFTATTLQGRGSQGRRIIYHERPLWSGASALYLTGSVALADALQPPLMTLLSSSSHPSISPLWTTHTDSSLPSDSFITTLPDTSYGSEAEASSSSRVYVSKHPTRGEIVGSVIHIQSPTVGTTYLQCGESLTEYRRRVDKGKARAGEGPMPLGIELGWVGLQVRRLGRREFAFEIGLVDTKGREGVVRCSSFKVCPSVTMLPPVPVPGIVTDTQTEIAYSPSSSFATSHPPPSDPPRTEPFHPHSLASYLTEPSTPHRTLPLPAKTTARGHQPRLARATPEEAPPRGAAVWPTQVRELCQVVCELQGPEDMVCE